MTISKSYDIPDELLPWLLADGSLTQKFEQLAEQPLRVEPTFEGFKKLYHSQLYELGLSRTQMAWVREVLLYGDDIEAWAKATSIFPISALQGKSRRLRHLGSTPLGYVLFDRHKPICQREISQTLVDNQTCFSRKNYYDWHGHTLLVAETFLPAFVEKMVAGS